MKIQGELIQLRDFKLEDADDAAAIIGDDRVTRWLSFDSRSREDAVRMMETAIKSALVEPRTEYYLGITTHSSDRVIGFARLGLGGVRAAKLGFAISADHWGKGYATDAAAFMCAFGLRELGLHRISAAIGPKNEKSIKIVEKLGFKLEGCIRDHVFTNGAWRDSLLYSLLEDEISKVNQITARVTQPKE